MFPGLVPRKPCLGNLPYFYHTVLELCDIREMALKELAEEQCRFVPSLRAPRRHREGVCKGYRLNEKLSEGS